MYIHCIDVHVYMHNLPMHAHYLPVSQLGMFLSPSEETVEGYEPPSLITEMHLHLQDFRLEYWWAELSSEITHIDTCIYILYMYV